MSRSFKKTPVIDVACTGKSENKKWKQSYNRAYRRSFNQYMNTINFSDLDDIDNVIVLPLKKLSIADIWSSPNDGWYYYPLVSEDVYNTSPSYLYWKEPYSQYKFEYFMETLRK